MTDTSEQHRHRCETRHLIRQVSERGREWVRQYLDDKRVAGRQAGRPSFARISLSKPSAAIADKKGNGSECF